ncbi:MAG: hypothetical protein SH817_14075 [Leptospira sp.]|nr:hypothetical protein [Leptospira sp.]
MIRYYSYTLIKLIAFAFIFISFGCANKKEVPPYWILILLGQGNAVSSDSLDSGVTQAPSLPVAQPNPPDISSGTNDSNSNENLPVLLTIESILPKNQSGACQNFGGLLVSFNQGTRVTCNASNINEGCFRVSLTNEGNISYIDPRSYVGLELPINKPTSYLTFPGDQLSIFHCFNKQIPISEKDIILVSSKGKKANPNQCLQGLNGNICQDTLKLFVDTEFRLPQKLNITHSEETHSFHDQILEIRYISTTENYVSCLYGAFFDKKETETNQVSFLAKNVSEKYKVGYCLECKNGFCDTQVNQGYGPLVVEDAYLIPENMLLTARKFIYLGIWNGKGNQGYSVSWNVEGYHPTQSSFDVSELAAFISDSFDNPRFITGLFLIIFSLFVVYLLKLRSSSLD